MVTVKDYLAIQEMYAFLGVDPNSRRACFGSFDNGPYCDRYMDTHSHEPSESEKRQSLLEEITKLVSDYVDSKTPPF